MLLDEVAEAGLDVVVGGEGGAVVGEWIVGEYDVEDGVFAGGLGGDFCLGAEQCRGLRGAFVRRPKFVSYAPSLRSSARVARPAAQATGLPVESAYLSHVV